MMDLRQAILLALQVSLLGTVFGFGLKTSVVDLLYLLRRPGLLARSLLAILVVMPLVTVGLVRIFDFPPTVEIVMVALAISPVPPLLPRKETMAGGNGSYGLGLMALLAVLAIVLVPASLALLERLSARPLSITPEAVSRLVVRAMLVPLTAGVAIRALMPALAERLEKAVTTVATVLLPVAIVALLANTLSAIWALVGPGTLIALTMFTVIGLGVGHALGGRDPSQSSVLALSTACRHPAVALSIAATNFPEQHFGPLLLLYLIVSTVAGIPYLAWQRRQTADTVPAA